MVELCLLDDVGFLVHLLREVHLIRTRDDRVLIPVQRNRQ